MPQPHALISGAGIAGPALACQLAADDWRVTVVERAPALRDEGQNVDIRGAAREVVRRLGILDAVRAANTTEVGMRFVREDGSVVAQFPVGGAGDRDGPTAELEILRGELSRILHEHSRTGADYRFGTAIADLQDHGDHVSATFDDGDVVDADIVVIAEGLRSRSRRLVATDDVTDLGMYFAYLTIPRAAGDSLWWEWLHVPGSRAVHLRPDNRGTTRVVLSFAADVRGLEALDRAGQLTVLRRTFADVGGPVPRILEALDDAPVYFDAVGQRRAPLFGVGRVALLGDAAFCNATFGGAGTSLALLGSYVLAGELAGADDHRAAVARFDRYMRPVAEDTPKVHGWTLRRANPASRTGIRALHAGARIAASRPIRAAASLAGRGITLDIADVELPDHPERAGRAHD